MSPEGPSAPPLPGEPLMADYKLPEFNVFRGDLQKPATKAIVFVHGIFSSHATFQKMSEALANDARFNGYDLNGGS